MSRNVTLFLCVLSLSACSNRKPPVLGIWQSEVRGSLPGADSVTVIYQFQESGEFHGNITARDRNGQRTAEQRGTWSMNDDTLSVTIDGDVWTVKLTGRTAHSLSWVDANGEPQQWTRIGNR